MPARSFLFRFFNKLFARRLIRTIYLGLLGREPDAAGSEGHRNNLARSGSLLEPLRSMAQSQELWEKLIEKKAGLLVRGAYQGLLQREPNEAELAAHSRQLAASKNFAHVLAALGASEEHWEIQLGHRSEKIVGYIFRGLLNRAPQRTEGRAYAETLRSTADITEVVKAMLDSRQFKLTHGVLKSIGGNGSEQDLPCLVFLHIEKAAGTTLMNLLERTYGREIYAEHGNLLYYHSPAQLASYSVFAGHFNYDALRYIPRKRMSTITFFREPMKRLASLYHFWRAHEPAHPLFHYGMQLAAELPMEQFFRHQKLKTDPSCWNHMTWMTMGDRQWRDWAHALSALGSDCAREDFIERNAAPAMRARLGELFFFGLQEDFDRSVRLLFECLQRPIPDQIPFDHSLSKLISTEAHFKRAIDMQEITDDVEASAAGLMELDRVLYREAKSLYDQRLEKSAQ